jgi:hypothetical protein
MSSLFRIQTMMSSRMYRADRLGRQFVRRYSRSQPHRPAPTIRDAELPVDELHEVVDARGRFGKVETAVSSLRRWLWPRELFEHAYDDLRGPSPGELGGPLLSPLTQLYGSRWVLQHAS